MILNYSHTYIHTIVKVLKVEDSMTLRIFHFSLLQKMEMRKVENKVGENHKNP